MCEYIQCKSKRFRRPLGVSCMCGIILKTSLAWETCRSEGCLDRWVCYLVGGVPARTASVLDLRRVNELWDHGDRYDLEDSKVDLLSSGDS